MPPWSDRRALDLLNITQPIVQAPMAGAQGVELAIAVSRAGGLGSLPCAMLTPAQVADQVAAFRAASSGPLNLNFFCHRPAAADAAREQAWRERLAPFYRELGIGPETPIPVSNRAPFDAAFCEVVEALQPDVVSFHFGLPAPDLLARVKASGARVLSSATTVDEARWLAQHGCDAIIAQGAEAGGHRGLFLGDEVCAQPGLLALLPRVAKAVDVPVIAAGAIADGRGMAAALQLGAAAVQVGTAYLFCPEAGISAPHRAALMAAGDNTALTNVFTGRPARGILNRAMRELGPISPLAPAFPLAGGALAPLRAAAEAQGSGDFSPLWAGQAVALARDTAHGLDAAALTQRLASEAHRWLRAQPGDVQ
ncbi:MAG: nitronate monooxygenase [Hydrogenophaga sp.]|nr:nitronate monooxygenase [Hydrogenophaga sp.]